MDNTIFRDKIMAQFISEKYIELQKNKSNRKKILVIMNYRHAFKSRGVDMADYLNVEFPDEVSNIMLNSQIDESMPSGINAPVQNGKCDAAFRYLNNPNIGFNFQETAFGKDHFDFFEAKEHNFLYQDIFDGFIFYKPLEDHITNDGIPGFVDKDFAPIFKKRYEILKEVDPDLKSISYDELVNNLNRKKISKYPYMKNCNIKIEQWLKY